LLYGGIIQTYSTYVIIMTTSSHSAVTFADDNERQEEDVTLPSFKQRFDKLKPSRELLQFYRSKFIEYDAEYQELCKKIESYESVQLELQKCHLENQQREDEIKQLQQALSDMQVYLFQEREHVLRLYAENDRLKIKDLESRKKIQHLLTIQGTVGSNGGESTYIFKEPPAKVLIQQHSTSNKGRGPGGHKKVPLQDEPDKEGLLLTVESLNAQLEEHTRLCKEQIDALMEDRQVKCEEADVRNQRDSNKIQHLSDQYKKSQSLLYDSTKDYLQVKYEMRAKEREWIAEKDKLLQELDIMREQLSAATGQDSLLDFSCFEEGEGGSSHSKGPDVAQLQLQLQQTQQLSDWYREQCIKNEEELNKVKEESEASKELFRQRTAKLNKRLELMNSRYEALEKRRSLEVEGYKSDIKLLRQKMKDLEKKLYKVTSCISGASNDLDIMAYVKKTAATSNKIMGNLQNMKGKLYTIEKDFRNVHNH
jgi:coiled-coil domain-containing protein 77